MTATLEQLKHISELVESIPDGTPERAEAEAFVYMTCARALWRKADRLRQAEREREKREARRRNHVEGCLLRVNHVGDCSTNPTPTGAPR